jgi:hypothetical protein
MTVIIVNITIDTSTIEPTVQAPRANKVAASHMSSLLIATAGSAFGIVAAALMGFPS